MAQVKFTRPDRFPPIVKNLIIINVLVFVTQLVLDRQYDITNTLVMRNIIPTNLKDLLIAQGAYEQDLVFKPYQLATHMFAHAPGMLFHIVFNMFTLWMFGRVLENVWGGKRFLFFYFACGIGAAALHLAMQYYRCTEIYETVAGGGQLSMDNLVTIYAGALGASGAVMGVMAGFAYLFPNTELFFMFIPIPIKAKWAIIGLMALDLFGGVARISGDNVAHFAHLGGALTGLIIVMIWNKTNRRTLY